VLYARPLVFRSARDLADGLPDVDVVVATFWPTAAEWLPPLRRRRPDLRCVYFLQDYEPWFLPEDDAAGRRRIAGTYALADARLVTSAWLQAKVAEHGHDSTVIPIGIDLRVFYPRERAAPASPRRVLVQARPSDRWRGFDRARVVLERLAQRRPDVTAVLFGCDDAALARFDLRFPRENRGVVRDRAAVARLYASCDVLFDPSRFQAFGLPGLEAMACATPAVLPGRGGILEYARHEENSLLVDPDDLDASVTAIERLLDDDALRARLIAGGRATSAAFSSAEMARRHEAFYRAVVAGRAPSP
jgi:glycosyltransferase involved in cell wall biosynthesis